MRIQYKMKPVLTKTLSYFYNYRCKHQLFCFCSIVIKFLIFLFQKELFTHKLESDAGASRERKMSASSTASMKNKWLKAFKSLKTPPPEETK